MLDVIPDVRAVKNWSPGMLPGLVAHYDLSDIGTLFKDTGFSTPVTADGDHILGIKDKSGQGWHMPAAVNYATYKTAIRGALSIGRFSSTDFELADGPDCTSFSVYVAHSSTTHVDYSGPMYLRVASKGGLHLTGGAEAGQYRPRIVTWDGAAEVISRQRLADYINQFLVLTWVSPQNAPDCFINGVDVANPDVGAGFSGSGFHLGRGYGGFSYLTGDVGEAALFNVQHDMAQRTAMEYYLMKKWGV